MREEDWDYIFAVYREVKGDECVVEADVRLLAPEFHDAVDVDGKRWVDRRTPHGYYREMGIRWSDVPVLGWYLPERFEYPLTDFRGWDKDE